MRRVLVLLMLAVMVGTQIPAAAEERLPTDPALVTGTLPNGLSYIVRPHKNPEGRVSIWLHVSSGSLNETDATRGLAHYLEHMAFNGRPISRRARWSRSFSPSASLSAATRTPSRASIGPTYRSPVPGAPQDARQGLLFMSDVASRLSLGATEIDCERQIILEEKRSRSSARQRVQDQLYERLAPSPRSGRRLPIGTEETIRAGRARPTSATTTRAGTCRAT